MQEMSALCAGPTCPESGPIDARSPVPHMVLGETPAGILLACAHCGYERIEPAAAAEEEAARREAQVSARGADVALARTIGPLSTGELTRLRHPDQVTAMTRAAEHAVGTPESVVLYLRAVGFELVVTEPVHCLCPLDVTTNTTLRNPVCPVHGDADEDPAERDEYRG